MADNKYKKHSGDIFWIVLLCSVCACIAVFAAIQLAADTKPYRDASREYKNLRKTNIFQSAATDTPITTPSDINPDYVGWITIDGIDIDYPIVQSEDNDKYLTTTFEGNENKLGAIFLDFRCADDFSDPYTIVYGHNAQNGSMFGSLAELLTMDEKYPDINITLPNDKALTYRVYAVRQTDITDPAYRLDFADDEDITAFAADMGASDSDHLLILSTCANSGDLDDRIVVLAVQIETDD